MICFHMSKYVKSNIYNKAGKLNRPIIIVELWNIDRQWKVMTGSNEFFLI